MWFSLLTIVFIFGVTALMYKYSGWWWLVYLLWGWSHVVFLGPVTIAYVVCILFLAYKKNPNYLWLLLFWDWTKVFLLL